MRCESCQDANINFEVVLLTADTLQFACNTHVVIVNAIANAEGTFKHMLIGIVA